MHIAVVGAGIIGLSTAYWLARDGHNVTVIERHAQVGRGASHANGGQLSYSYVAPFAGAATLISIPGWLANREGPVRFRPSLELAQWRWIAGFVRACTAACSRATTEKLLKLAFFSRDSLRDMMSREQLSFEHRPNGKLVFYSSRASLANAVEQMRLQAQLGCMQTALSADECIALEPALRSVANRLVGGIFTPSDEAGDCRKLCEELHRVLSGPRYKVRFELSCGVDRLLFAKDRIVGMRTSNGLVDADLYVLCNGLESRSLLRTANHNVPLYPITGYSVSPSIVDRSLAPAHSITDYQKKIVYAPLGPELRVAGFADISRVGRPDGSRLALLVREVGEVFPGACSLERVRPWVGSRPATPSGAPIVGRIGYTNLLVNVGHGALGFTLAAGSGHLIANMVGEGATPTLAPYALDSMA